MFRKQQVVFSLLFLGLSFGKTIANAEGVVSSSVSVPPMASFNTGTMTEEEFEEWCSNVPGCGQSQFGAHNIQCGGYLGSAQYCDGKYHINIVYLYDPCLITETVQKRIPYVDEGQECCLTIYWRDVYSC